MKRQNELVWWSISKDGMQYVCTLPDRRESQTIGAHATHGPWVAFPFEIVGPATPDEVAWAESEMDLAIASREREDELRCSLEE